MNWFFLAILYVFFGSLANIFRKILLKDDRSDALGSAIIFQILGAFIIGVVALLHGFIFPSIQLYSLNLLLNAILWGIATLTLFKAYQYIEASEVTIITTIEAIVVIITAHFFLHESFTLANVIGTVLIILAVSYISHVSSTIKFSKGVLFAVGSSFFAGLGVVNDTFMLRHSDPLSYLAIGFLLPGLFLFVVHPKIIIKMKPLFQPSLLKKNIIFTSAYSFAAIAFSLSLVTGGEASQVGTIAQSNVVMTVILATVILNERDHLLKKLICAILVTIGVLLMR